MRIFHRGGALLVGVLLVVFCFRTAFAISITTDRSKLYSEAMINYELGLYDDAAVGFESCGNYADAPNWTYYCEGLSLLESATDMENLGDIDGAKAKVEQSKQYFKMLEGMNFADSSMISKYCEGRLSELKGMRQAAIDTYDKITGVLDTGIRYLRLNDPEYIMPTQSPQNTSPGKLQYTLGRVNKTVPALLGPGNNYQSLGSITNGSEVKVCGIEGNFYLIEYEGARMWINKIRVSLSESKALADLGKYPKRNAVVLNATKLLYGPGNEYLSADVWLGKGDKVRIFQQEDDYTMVEYEAANTKPARFWIMTKYLSK